MEEANYLAGWLNLGSKSWRWELSLRAYYGPIAQGGPSVLSAQTNELVSLSYFMASRSRPHLPRAFYDAYLSDSEAPKAVPKSLGLTTPAKLLSAPRAAPKKFSEGISGARETSLWRIHPCWWVNRVRRTTKFNYIWRRSGRRGDHRRA